MYIKYKTILSTVKIDFDYTQKYRWKIILINSINHNSNLILILNNKKN